METKNQMTLSSMQEMFLKDITNSTKSVGIPLDEYSKTCVFTALGAVSSFVKEKKLVLGRDVSLTTLKASLQNVAILKLNVANGEVFLDYHRGWGNVMGTLKLTIQGNGYESIVNHFGQGIKRNGLKAPWLVREGEKFTLPSFNGLECVPPTWFPTYNSSKHVIYIVYPLVKDDNSIEWLTTDRESVKANLIAHIHNSGRVYFKDNADKQDKLDADLESKSLDEILDNGVADIDKFLGVTRTKDTPMFISPAWTSPSSREGMIVRKMKNNALRKYPLNLDNVAYKTALNELDDDKDETIIEGDSKPAEVMPSDTKAIEDFDVPSEPAENKPETKKASDDSDLKPEEEAQVAQANEKGEEAEAQAEADGLTDEDHLPF